MNTILRYHIQSLFQLYYSVTAMFGLDANQNQTWNSLKVTALLK